MSVYSGNKKISEIYSGNNKINKIYKGNTLVYIGAPDPIPTRFEAKDAIQYYDLPSGTGHIRVECVGSQGRSEAGSTDIVGGKGGKVTCLIDVKGLKRVSVWAGLQPTGKEPKDNASWISKTDNKDDMLVIAGGGGGYVRGHYGVHNHPFSGGAGGGLTGADGVMRAPDSWLGGHPARGGTQTAGGQKAEVSFINTTARGNDGQKWLGGAMAFNQSDGGSGGAGWYGGGGGCCNFWYAGGGSYAVEPSSSAGGSSWTEPTLCTEVKHTQGFQSGNGYVIITPYK